MVAAWSGVFFKSCDLSSWDSCCLTYITRKCKSKNNKQKTPYFILSVCDNSLATWPWRGCLPLSV